MFRHGVASGDPRHDRVVIWTRITGDEQRPTVNWELARDEAITDVVATGTTTTDPTVDFTVHVDVDGLAPATHYSYRFQCEGVVSPVGRTRTLPETDAENLRFAMVSCAKFNAGYFNGYARIADRDDLNFVLHLGDYIYEASNTPPASQTPGADIGRPFDPLHECMTLDDYRRRYAQYHLDPDVQRMHATHPVIATLDDHEFADGAWRDGATEHREAEHGPWADRKATAFRVRWEWIPARMPDPADPQRVWRTIPLGTLADLYLLDTRTQRDEPVPDPHMRDPERSALGSQQRGWLFAELSASDATWRLVGNPSVMGQTWTPRLPEDVRPALLKVKLVDADSTGPDYDQWDGYPVERRAILDFLEGIDDVIVLSADLHISIAAELNQDPFEVDEPVAVEVVAPSLTSQNLDDKMKWARRTESLPIEHRLLEVLPHWKWCDLDSHGYVVIDVTPARVRAEWWLMPTVLERVDNEELGTAFEVAHGHSRLIPG
jgi:alkaline phosphatase D